MAYVGFRQYSGPNGLPRAQNPSDNSPRASSPTPQLPGPTLHRSPRELEAPEKMHSPPLAFESNRPIVGSYYSSAGVHRPPISSPVWGSQPRSFSNFVYSLPQPELPSVSPIIETYDSGGKFPTNHVDVQVPKRMRSPPSQSTNKSSWEDSHFARNDSKRASLSPPRLSAWSQGLQSSPDSQTHQWSLPAAHINDAEAAATKPSNFPAPKRTRSPPLPSADLDFQQNSYAAQEDAERELQAKAKRLARFKDELNQPVQSSLGINQKVQTNSFDRSLLEKQKFVGKPSDVSENFSSVNNSSDYEGLESSGIIIGLCPDMCPVSERAERERKGDLDQYERLDGDRNQTSKYLAVKKYNRTADREADLIRPMPILQKTMDYLLNLLDQPSDERFLGLYNFLWDRMRAIRMDLRMQHIFNLDAITMLEQMIRLHIIAMHELCEYSKGEGFSEGFDAHLNIEQMNKTSVELFQFYDDHRKKGIDVPTEREFRGYYALLKLDKHPGYRVEPAELSLDLARMTREIRQTPEVLFARDVARACRTGNFIAFFRLARKASYLQACLIHAHFGKLRTQALASLHSGLQNNQGIPVNHVSRWLGMEEEDIEYLLEYHGFVVKEFEKPYMVKEGPFLNGDNDYPVKCSKLVHLKKSKRIFENVSSPHPVKTCSSKKVEELQLDKVFQEEAAPVQSVATKSYVLAADEEMPDYLTISSPKNKMQTKAMLGTSDQHVAAVSPVSWDSSLVPGSFESPQTRLIHAGKLKDDNPFRNSLEKCAHYDMKTKPVQVVLGKTDQERLPVLQIDPAVDNVVPQSVFAQDLADEEHTDIHPELETDEVAISYHDEEVAQAKLKLILRIWRRCSTKKRELREQKLLAANAALSLLSLGPPIWRYKDQPIISDEFNIDQVMSERYQKHERSWSRLNVSHVIAAELSRRNPDAKCLCWKLVLCSQMNKLESKNQVAQSAVGQWLLSKLVPANKNNDDNLIMTSPGLSIWKKWVPSQSDGDLTSCLSVIKDTEFDNLTDAVAGANAVLFVVSEGTPLTHQKIRLHKLLMSLPSGSCLPLLILIGADEDHFDSSMIIEELGLNEIEKSQVSGFLVIFLTRGHHMEHLDGFFSDEQLREGLQWLARESPVQPVLHCIKTRELVLDDLNCSLDVLEKLNASRVTPDHCISAFNEALEGSMVKIAAAATANPACWPCPEIALLEGSSNEYRAVEQYLPTLGWSSCARTKPLLNALNNCKLLAFPDELSWLDRGSDMGSDIENQRLKLENCLIKYLTQSSQILGLSLATKEARIMLQKCSGLELHDSTYYIVPKWVKIFRRIFNWRLMSITSGLFSAAYVLAQHDVAFSSSGDLDRIGLEGCMSPTSYIVGPTLDEMFEVGCRPLVSEMQQLDHEACQPPVLIVSKDREVQKASNETDLMEDKRTLVQCDNLTETNGDYTASGLNNTNNSLMVATEVTKEAVRLNRLLEKCNIVQDMIDEKLAVYF